MSCMNESRAFRGLRTPAGGSRLYLIPDSHLETDLPTALALAPPMPHLFIKRNMF